MANTPIPVPSAPRPSAPPRRSSQDISAIQAELRDALAPGIQVLDLVGAGGMGLVFLGRDPMLKRAVAIKVLAESLADDTTARARFVREAESAAAVVHPNVVAVHHVGTLPRSEALYIVMQYVEGRTLAEELAAGRTFSEIPAARLLGEIASALSAAHARGVVHRDVKPSNVLLEEGSGRALVHDFGISAVRTTAHEPTDSRITQQGMYVGTPGYMSPEQASGEDATEKSDVYALGILAFEVLTGQPPFTGAPLAVLAAQVRDMPPSMHALRPDLSAHVAQLVDRCLEKDPARRPSAQEVAHALLPERAALIEWPPPGLERLRGRGRVAARVIDRWYLALVLFLTLLAVQPSPAASGQALGAMWGTMVRPDRLIRDEPIDRAGAVASADPEMTTGPWIALLGLTAAAVLTLTGSALLRGARLAEQLAQGRCAGFPLPVLLDVAWDDAADTGDLVNGAGRFVFLSRLQRDTLQRLRRLEAIVPIVGVVGSALLVLLWAGVGVGRMHEGSRVVLWPELGALLVPLLLATGVLGVLAARRRMLLLDIAPLTRARAAASQGVPPELVKAWLSSAGRGRFVPAGRWRTLALPAVGMLALAAMTLAIAIIMVAVVVSNGRSTRHGAEAARWLAAQRDSTPPLQWRELDSILAKAGGRARGGPPDWAAARLLLAKGLRPVDDSRSVFNADIRGARYLVTVGPSISAAARYRWLLNYRDPLAVPKGDTMSLIAADPWLAVWRRFATSAPFPHAWAYREGGFAQIANPWAALPLNFQELKEMAYRNVLLGRSELRDGNVTSAIQRAREDIAAGRMIANNFYPSEEVGGVAIAGIGNAELEAIGRVTRDSALLREAIALREARIRWRRERLPFAAVDALFAEPDSGPGYEYAPRLSPALQFEMIATAPLAFCNNPREILFGIDPRRFANLERIVGTDRPRMREVVPTVRRSLGAIVQGGWPSERSDPPPATFRFTQALGAAGLLNRMQLCIQGM